MLRTRRNFFNISALTSLLVAAGCSKQTVGKVTTVTVNVQQVDLWAQAAENTTVMIVNLPGLPIDVVTKTAITTIGATVANDIAAWDQQTKGQTSFTIDTTNPKSIGMTLLTDCESVLTQARAAAAKSVNAQVMQYVNALALLVSLFQAQLNMLPTALKPGDRAMSEKEALQILQVKR